MIDRDEIIHDWNLEGALPRPAQAFDLFDESLRDGLQSPSVADPPLEDKLRLLELIDALGIQAADIGLPAAGRRNFDDLVALASHAKKKKLRLELNAAGRTVVADVRAIVEASQQSGVRLGVYAFIGSSPIRMWAEGWDAAFIRKQSEEAVAFGTREGLDVAYVTEDTTRSQPAMLELLFKSAIDAGAKRLVLCDTVGHATPEGTTALVRWAGAIAARHNPSVKLDWHGHNDRGLAVVNAVAALQAGAHRVHGCGLGIGERVGNTSLDLLLLNLKLWGWVKQDLSRLVEYVQLVSSATKVAVPANYPLSGADAFRTATGVHAAAIIKAKQKGDDWLADRVYSGVPAGEFGKAQTIEVGPMSGLSNVRYWLSQRKLPCTDELCQRILQKAKAGSAVLTERQLLALIKPRPAKPSATKRRKTERRAAAHAG